MPVNLSIKNTPDRIVKRLKQRAKNNHRSLQGELLAIVEEAVEARPRALTIGQLRAKIKRLNFQTPAESAAIIRRDRDAR